MRAILDRAAIKLALGLSRSVQQAMVRRFLPKAEGQGMHPDFATILALQAMMRVPSIEVVGQNKGVDAARDAYGHVMAVGAPRLPRGAVVEARDMTVTGADGPIPARLYVPKGARAEDRLLVYFHGGGFVVGRLDDYDALLRYLVWHSGVPILSVDYRLAPEHPYPAAPDDCVAAVINVASGGFEFTPKQLGIGGDSAGGALALVAGHAAIKEGYNISALWLFNPGLHPLGDYPSHDKFGTGCGFTDDMRIWFESLFLGSDNPLDEGATPLFLPDLDILPPVWLSVGGVDLLQDQAELFKSKLEQAGVALTFHKEPGLIHNYHSFSGVVEDARLATDKACLWLKNIF